MEIGGKFIKRNRKVKCFDRYYFDALTRFVGNDLRNQKFVKDIKVIRSKSTDSIYFYLELKGMSNKIKLSLRTHAPKEYPDDGVYLNVARYRLIRDLRYAVIKKLCKEYQACLGPTACILPTRENFQYVNSNMSRKKKLKQKIADKRNRMPHK